MMEDAVNNGNRDGLEQPKKRKRRSNESEPIIISPAAGTSSDENGS